MAGGDSSARGVMAGMILAARHGSGFIPEDWISGMRKEREIKELISKLL